jgi:hypothetical protein
VGGGGNKLGDKRGGRGQGSGGGRDVTLWGGERGAELPASVEMGRSVQGGLGEGVGGEGRGVGAALDGSDVVEGACEESGVLMVYMYSSIRRRR